MRRASPVDPILRIPNEAINDTEFVQRTVLKYNQFSLDRIEWMRRREKYYLGWDDYTSPVRKGLWEGSSNLHLPMTEEKCTVMHALIMQAMFFNYPWFYIDPQEDVDIHRLQKAERFMKYVLERYCNYNKGIYTAMDDWAWDLVTGGIGILSRSWRNEQRRVVTVEENASFKRQRIDLQMMLEDTEEKEFSKLAEQIIKQPYIEKAIIKTVFNGPMVIAEDPKYVLFKGEVVDCTDLNEHETVIKVCYFTRAQLLSFKESEYFDEKVVDEVLSSPPDLRYDKDSQFGLTQVRRAQDIQTGVNTISPNAHEDTWEFLCTYDSYPISGKSPSAYPDKIQGYIHARTRNLARWTYLDRISTNGKIPLHMAHLFRRPRRSTGRGMVETMWGLNDAQDILVNQQIDAGMLANNPMFAYNGNGTFDPEEIRVEPGIGIKADDPNNDIRFFTWNVNPNWSLSTQNTISSYADKLTSLGPNQTGQVGSNVGPLRSNAGLRSLNQMAGTQQNVLIKRAANCITELFEGIYSDCCEMMPPKMKISVTGPEGVPVYDDMGVPMYEEISKQELSMRLHFGIYANPMNMDTEQRKQNAAAIAQFSFQRLPLETGVITPDNVYNILSNMHQAMGTMHSERFLTKPKTYQPETIEWEMKKIMQGIMPMVLPNDPGHEAKLEILRPLLDSDTAQLEASNGVIAKNAPQVLKAVIALHEKYAAMMEKPSNVENPFGSNQSPTLGLQDQAAAAGGEMPREQSPMDEVMQGGGE